MKKQLVTRSKGGYRRKPRRITPGTIANYWPDAKRLTVLRRTWPAYKPNWMIVDLINRNPAPKPVTVWQCKLMASHLGLRRPIDIGIFTRRCQQMGPDTTLFRLRGKHQIHDQITIKTGVPEPDRLLRKVGRKPKPKQRPRRKARTFSVGMSMDRPRMRKKALVDANRSKPKQTKGRKRRSVVQ